MSKGGIFAITGTWDLKQGCRSRLADAIVPSSATLYNGGNYKYLIKGFNQFKELLAVIWMPVTPKGLSLPPSPRTIFPDAEIIIGMKINNLHMTIKELGEYATRNQYNYLIEFNQNKAAALSRFRIIDCFGKCWHAGNHAGTVAAVLDQIIGLHRNKKENTCIFTPDREFANV